MIGVGQGWLIWSALFMHGRLGVCRELAWDLAVLLFSDTLAWGMDGWSGSWKQAAEISICW
jgi:hypothetical protein